MELQGVSLVALSFFRDQEAARKLADTVAEHGGVLGACVCCAEIGGEPSLCELSNGMRPHRRQISTGSQVVHEKGLG